MSVACAQGEARRRKGWRRGMPLALLLLPLALTACQRARPIPLEGWHYHWGELPRRDGGFTFSEARWHPLPGAGRRIAPAGRRGEQILWLKARLPPLPERDPSLHVGHFQYAGEIYLAGQRRYAWGKVGVAGEGRFSGHRWHLIPLHAAEGGQTLYFRVYSERPHRIGLRGVGVVERSVWIDQVVHRGIHFVALGLLFLLLGAFSLTVAAARRDGLHLAFGLLAAPTGVMTLFDNRVVQLFASATGSWYALLVAMPLLAMVGSCLLFEQIVARDNPRFVRRLRWLLVVVLVPRVLLQLTLWLPAAVDPIVSIMTHAVIGIALLGLLAVALRAGWQGQLEAKIFAFGFGVFGTLLLVEVADLDSLLHLPPDLYPWGMLVFLLAVGVLVERRFRRAAAELAAKNAELLAYSHTLEEKVRVRTEDLDAKNQELAGVNRSLERLVAERTQQLVEQEKTAIIGRMIQGIAHNLKTPLAVVKSNNQLVQKKVQKVLDDPAHEQLAARTQQHLSSLVSDAELVGKAQAQIVAIIDTLMLKSRLDHALETKLLDLNELLQHEIEFFQANPIFKHQVKKTVELDEDLPRVELVATNITQVIENLVSNALDAMYGREEKKLILRTRHDEERVYLDVADSGSGIDAANLSRIFDLFYTSKPPKGEAAEGEPAGTGLGLHTCVELLRPLGGRLTVESEVGVGSTFTIELPRQRPAATTGPLAPVPLQQSDEPEPAQQPE